MEKKSWKVIDVRSGRTVRMFGTEQAACEWADRMNEKPGSRYDVE